MERLAEAVRDAEAVAEVLDYFADILRGRRPDPDGPALEQFPSAGQVRRAFDRRTDCLAAAEEAWHRLSHDEKEHLTPEDSLTNGVDLTAAQKAQIEALLTRDRRDLATAPCARWSPASPHTRSPGAGREPGPAGFGGAAAESEKGIGDGSDGCLSFFPVG